MPLRKSKRKARNQALLRYEKQRKRNLLARPGIHDFIIVLDHLKAGYNVPKIFRSAEAFGATEIHLIDIGPFDPAPAKGAFKSVPAKFYDDFDSSYRFLQELGYNFFILDIAGATALSEVDIPRKSAFIFGHEERGISFEPSLYSNISSIFIPQFGKVESLNVSIAASIVMYQYTQRWRGNTQQPSSQLQRVDNANKLRRKKR